jgi:hypothetical protein
MYFRAGIAQPPYAVTPGYEGSVHFFLPITGHRAGDLPANVDDYDLWGNCCENHLFCVVVGDGRIEIQTMFSVGSTVVLTAYLRHQEPGFTPENAYVEVVDEVQTDIPSGSVVTFDVSTHGGKWCTHQIEIVDSGGICGNGWGFGGFVWTPEA